VILFFHWHVANCIYDFEMSLPSCVLVTICVRVSPACVQGDSVYGPGPVFWDSLVPSGNLPVSSDVHVW
jgi:hypothetical protein